MPRFQRFMPRGPLGPPPAIVQPRGERGESVGDDALDREPKRGRGRELEAKEGVAAALRRRVRRFDQ